MFALLNKVSARSGYNNELGDSGEYSTKPVAMEWTGNLTLTN